MKVTVTQGDIDQGVRFIADGCAIALAVKRATCAEDVVVTWHVVEVNGRAASVPSVATEFITKFDGEEPVQPFSFWLDLGDGAERFEAPEVQAEVPA